MKSLYLTFLLKEWLSIQEGLSLFPRPFVFHSSKRIALMNSVYTLAQIFFISADRMYISIFFNIYFHIYINYSLRTGNMSWKWLPNSDNLNSTLRPSCWKVRTNPCKVPSSRHTQTWYAYMHAHMGTQTCIRILFMYMLRISWLVFFLYIIFDSLPSVRKWESQVFLSHMLVAFLYPNLSIDW